MGLLDRQVQLVQEGPLVGLEDLEDLVHKDQQVENNVIKTRNSLYYKHLMFKNAQA